MEDALYIWINKKCYRLYSHNDETWRLFYFCDRKKLNINAAHSLDFWCREGVLNGETEKKKQD